MGIFDRRRNGDDIAIGVAQSGGIAGERQRGQREIAGLDLAGPILAGAQLRDAPGVDIEADDRGAGTGKPDSDRQADVPQPDDRNLASVRHAAHIVFPSI